ncbi:hypothetical protein AB4Z51_40390 [Bradyrhizobium sp. 2TAF36]|uniref:hypothetical protein n=1 Tax=unclassified Bradyrhizobium TaxID=2631580 RepID=UPI001430C29D|nr:hypothetical protein [Bradyrhizobium sp. MOS001]
MNEFITGAVVALDESKAASFIVKSQFPAVHYRTPPIRCAASAAIRRERRELGRMTLAGGVEVDLAVLS